MHFRRFFWLQTRKVRSSGYEVLRDMYALAFCDGLVAGLSQVVNCARIVKESSGEEYDTLCIINNGINISGKQFTK